MKKILILSALMAALASTSAMAVDANVTFNGTVSTNTCTLNAADATKTLTLPSVSAATLYAAGTTAYTTYTTSGSFGFTACPSGLTKVTSNYTYQGSSLVSGTSGNSAVAGGTATNVALVLMQGSTGNSSTVVPANGTTNANNQTTISNNAATVPVTVGIWAANSSNSLTLPTAGTITGTYTVAFTYS